MQNKTGVSSSSQLSPASLQIFGIKSKNLIYYSPIIEIISLTKEYLTKINVLFHEPTLAMSHPFMLGNRETAGNVILIDLTSFSVQEVSLNTKFYPKISFWNSNN